MRFAYQNRKIVHGKGPKGEPGEFFLLLHGVFFQSGFQPIATDTHKRSLIYYRYQNIIELNI